MSVTSMTLMLVALLVSSGPVAAQPERTAPLPEWLQALQPVTGEFPVRPGHPRLYLMPEELPLIRQRIVATHTDEWGKVLRAKDSSDLTARMLANAFDYQMRADRDAARKAIDAALELAGGAVRADDDLQAAYRVWPESVVYDWCYEQFTPGERTALLGLVRRQLETAGGRILQQQPPHAGHLVNHLADAHLPAGIAFYDDDPSIFARALTVARTQLAAKNVFYRYGASSQGNSYGVTHVNGDFRLLALLYKATGVDLFAKFPFYQALGYYWIYTRRPDGQLLRNGDDWLDDMRQNDRVAAPSRDGASHVWTHPWLSELLLYGASRYGDRYLLAEYLKVRDLDRAWTAIEDIIWRDARLQPAQARSLRRVQYLGGAVGTLLFRTGWGMDDVVGMFKAMPLFAKNHDHLDRLSFQIYCRGALALDSGLYEGSKSGYDSDHWLNYMQRTIAHNSLLIRDPEEKLAYRGKPVNIDGGQFYPAEGANADRLQDITAPQWRLARVLAAGVDPMQEYAFVAADGTAGYGAKAELVRRTFVFLQGREGASAEFVIADRVVSRAPGHEKVWLLHSMEEPAIEGDTVVVRRTQGRNSGGTLVSRTLLPADPLITAIGGPGKEYWVNGTNYETVKGGDAEGGAWRIEVAPREERKSIDFLHALQVFPGLPASVAPATLIRGRNLAGAELPGWTVVLLEPGAARAPVSFVSRATGKRKHLVIGIAPHRKMTIGISGRKAGRAVADETGTVSFETVQHGATKITLR